MSLQTVYAASRLDRLPVSSFHWRILFLIASGVFLDAFDIYIGGGVLGSLVASGWSTLELNAAFGTMTFVGLTIGAWGAGIVGDRYGRRISYQFNLAVFGLASLAAVAAPNMIVLIVLRFIMGIGLGAELVIGYATMAEFAPPGQRGKLVAVMAFIANSAVFVASLTGLWVIPNLGWRYMFLIVGVGAMIVWVMRKNMPESPRWLESKGRLDEAEAIVSKIEAEVRSTQPLAEFERVVAPVIPDVSIGVLFSRNVIDRTLIGMLVFIAIGLGVYGLVSWLPTFFVKQGHSIVTSLWWSTVMSLGGPAGGLIGLIVADKVGRKPIIVVACVAATICGAVYQFAASDTVLLIIGFCLVTSLYTMIVVAQAIYVPELFPTEYRMRGVGACSTVGRFLSAFVQFIVVWIFNTGGVNAVIASVAAILLVEAIVIAVFGVETKQKRLEDVAPEKVLA